MAPHDLFIDPTKTNSFDNLQVDVKKLYGRYPLDQLGSLHSLPQAAGGAFTTVYRQAWLPLRWRQYLWHAWHRTLLDQTWFEQFQGYWSHILGGRPLWGVQDFYFLQGLYRMKFQHNQIPETGDSGVHLAAWQQPEVLYQLLHLVYKESLGTELAIIQKMLKYSSRPIKSYLDFGCAIGPIATTLFQFYPEATKWQIYLADLQALALHYAAYKFRHYKNVKPIILEPANNFHLTGDYQLDVITCLTVFEHLNEPLKTIQRLHEVLKPGGLLLFDYIKGDGDGLDTQQAINERPAVLKFMTDNFTLVEGQLDPDNSLGLTILRKK